MSRSTRREVHGSLRERLARCVARPFFAILAFLATHLPPATLAGLAKRVSRLVYYVFPGVRAGILANARHVLGPDAPDLEQRRWAQEVLASFARFLTELVAPAAAGPRQDLHQTSLGKEHFEAARAAGRGIIAVTLHMGNYELSGMELASLVSNVAVVYNRERITFLERLRSRLRKARLLDEIVIDDSRFFAIEVLRRLREGGVIVLAGDQVAARDGERFPFLHGTAAFSHWPARLAIASGAPLLPAFNVRLSDGTYRLHIEPPLFPLPGEAAEALLGRLVKIFERYVRDHGDQWLMIRPFWLD